MIEINYENLYRTEGNHYTYIKKEEFERYLEEGDQYELEDLQQMGLYTFFRVCKTDDGVVMFMKITGQIVGGNALEIVFMHNPMQGKTMLIQGYKENWFFIPGKI